MSVEWPLVRRAMLTQGDLFPKNDDANCMSAVISAEQMDVAIRCIKAFYQGLKWADQFEIQGGYVGNRNFRRTFLIEDKHVLGVFDNRNRSRQNTQLADLNPCSTEEFISFYRRGNGNIKTLIVLEKDNHRLANSEATGCQSKFLIDVVYPAIEGIRAKLSGDRYGHHWQKVLSEAQYISFPKDSTTGNLLHVSLLSNIYHNPKKADKLLTENSPLKLFYTWNSPLNLEFNSEEDTPSNLIPWEISEHPGLLMP